MYAVIYDTKFVYQYLSIANFRGLADLKIKPLGRINLIAGANDVGKTAILEALYLLFGANKQMDFPTAFRPANDANNSKADINFWRWLFPKGDYNKVIQVEIGDSKEADVWAYRTTLRFDPPSKAVPDRLFLFNYDKAGPNNTSQNLGQWSGRPDQGWGGVGGIIHPTIISFSINDISQRLLADSYNSVARLKTGEEQMEGRMRHLEPRLKRLRFLNIESVPMVYADIGFDELLPVTQFGSAFYRLITIFSRTIANQAKILLIDEIENSLHHSVYKKIWTELARLARDEDIQIFATTHSEECIKGAHEALLQNGPYDLAVHRVQRLADGKTEVITHNKEMLEASFATGLPIR